MAGEGGTAKKAVKFCAAADLTSNQSRSRCKNICACDALPLSLKADVRFGATTARGYSTPAGAAFAERRLVSLLALQGLQGFSWARNTRGRVLSAIMKQLIASRTLVIPEGVKVEVKARKVRVTGPRGTPL